MVGELPNIGRITVFSGCVIAYSADEGSSGYYLFIEQASRVWCIGGLGVAARVHPSGALANPIGVSDQHDRVLAVWPSSTHG